MGMPEQKPQNGMNIAPDGTVYEILEDGTIKRIGKVSSNGEFEPFGGPKDGIRVRDGFIYRVINGKEQKIGRILPNGEIESISQRIKSEAEISGNKVKIVAIVSVLIAFIISAGIYLFEEGQEAREAKIVAEERKKDEEYETKIKPVVDEYLQETSPKADKLNLYIEKLKLLRLSLKYEENKKKADKIISNIETKTASEIKKAKIAEEKEAEEERKKQEAEAKKAKEERQKREAEAKKAEEDRKRQEAETKKAEEERKRQEAEKAEEDRKRQEQTARYLQGRRIGNLVWSDRSSNKMTWSSAKQYCENLTEGGFTDWRLPTISELKTTIQNCQSGGSSCRVSDSCISLNCRSESCRCNDKKNNRGYYSKLGDHDGVWLWSSTTGDFGDKEHAWSVRFVDAYVEIKYKYFDFYVRCVR